MITIAVTSVLKLFFTTGIQKISSLACIWTGGRGGGGGGTKTAVPCIFNKLINIPMYKNS